LNDKGETIYLVAEGRNIMEKKQAEFEMPEKIVNSKI